MELQKMLEKGANEVVKTTKKHSAGILTFVGLAGVAGTIYTTVRATRKYDSLKNEHPDWNAKQILKEEWKDLAMVGVCGVGVVVGVVGSNAILSNRLQTAIMAAQIADNHSKELKEATKKVVSKQKYEEIMNEKRSMRDVDKQAGDGIYNINGCYPIGNKGEIGCAVRSDSDIDEADTLMYDDFSGRYFYSSVNAIRGICNRLTSKLLLDGNVTLNEFYEEAGLASIAVGEQYGWDANRGNCSIIEPEFSTTLIKSKPCVIVGFMREPMYGAGDY